MKRTQLIFIALLVALVSFLSWNFGVQLFRFDSVADNNAQLETALDLQLPLKPVAVLAEKKLLDSFSQTQIAQAEAELKKESWDKSSRRDLKQLLKQDEFEASPALKLYLDNLLLLYPNVSLDSIRFLVARDISQFVKDENKQKKTFKQFEKIFVPYVTLKSEIEKMPLDGYQYEDLKHRYAAIKALRVKYLGKALAQAMFVEEEEYIKQHVFKQAQ